MAPRESKINCISHILEVYFSDLEVFLKSKVNIFSLKLAFLWIKYNGYIWGGGRGWEWLQMEKNQHCV